jgi:hypothetical protein
MNILFLKTLAMNPNTLTYHSPQQKDFTWEGGIMVAKCEKCAPLGTIGIDCHCGIYGSPNPEALTEYAVHETSFNALLQAYGRVDVWTAPDDLWYCYVLRVWAARVIGIVETDGLDLLAPDARGQAAITAAGYFNCGIYSIPMAKGMIDITWKAHLNIEPYGAKLSDPWRNPIWNWQDPYGLWKPFEEKE